MHVHRGRFSRLLLSVVFALALLAPAMPALADGDEHEAEIANLEVKAAPAVVKSGHPVLIKARFRVDEVDEECAEGDEPSDEPTEEPTDEPSDELTEEPEEAEAQSEHDEEESSDDTDDDADNESEEAEDDDCEDADDESEEESEDDAEEESDEEDSEDDGEPLSLQGHEEGHEDDESDDESQEDSEDDADDDDVRGIDSDGCDTGETFAQGGGKGRGQGQGRGRGGDGCAPVSFTFDFGDGSEPVTVAARGKKADKAKAYAHHTYAEDGEYQVEVVATPDGGSPLTATITVQVGKGGARLSGRDRFETGTEISEDAFPEDGSADAVVLARADGFADALASATLATLADAPVLLTNSAELPDSVLAEIQRVLVPGGTVYVLGGTSAIAESVVTTLEGLGYTVERIAGTDRVDTSLQVAEEVVETEGEVGEVVVASAGNFPDALSGAAHAAKEGAPILLTPGNVLDPRVREFLAGLPEGTKVLVAGGAKVVSDAVVDEIRALGLDVERVSGKDRFATSAQIAEEEFAEATTVVIATGKAFPDALSGAAHAGRIDAPVLLVGDTLPEDVRAYLEAGAGRITTVYVLGGPNAVPAGVMAEIEAILGL